VYQGDGDPYRETKMDTVVEKFTAFATTANYDDLTPGALYSARRSIVDSIGCALGAFHAPPAKAVRALAARISAAEPATVMGTTIRTSPELAALANGTMIRYSDFSDDYFGGSGSTGPHPSDNIGGMIAAAEAYGADARTALLGVIIAYEVSGQLIDHTSLGSESGWDYTVLHAISSAAGAASILKLTPEQTANAISLAVVPNISLRETRTGQISNWKALAGPNGSRNGLFAAYLAQQGISGPDRPFDGKSGFMKQLNCPFELDSVPMPGGPFKIEETYLKAVPVRYTLQLPVWIAQHLRGRADPGEIETISVYITRRFAADRSTDPEAWDPRSRETADHSGPYLIGSALLHGAITDETYTPSRYRDPRTLELIGKIRMLEDPEYTRLFPATFKSRIEVTLKSGEVIREEQVNPKGHPANPMTAEEVNAKFLKQAEPVLGQDRANGLLELAWHFDEIGDLSALFAALLVTDEP
jgi:2-methylcitrate dehydratase